MFRKLPNGNLSLLKDAVIKSFAKYFLMYLFYSQIRCSVLPNIATFPSILQCSCANCSEQVAPELESCNYINFNKFVDFNTFLADFRGKNTAKQY